MADEEKITGQEGQTAEGQVPAAQAPADTSQQQATPPVVDDRYKGLQRKYQKLQDTHERQGEDFAALRGELATIRQMLEVVARPDKTNEFGEPDPSKLQEIEKLRQQVQQKQIVETGRKAVWEHLEDLASTYELGLDTPQTEESVRLFKAGNYEAAIKAFHKASKAYLKAQADAAKAETDAVKAQQEARKQALLEAETGGSGGLSTFAQTQAAYARGQIGYAEYAKALAARGESL